MSQVTGTVVLQVAATNPDIPAHVVASALAIICGAIICFLGVFRLGFIVDYISLAALSAYMTGSALNIAVSQVPTMMGIKSFSTRDPTYLVTIHILQHLNQTTLDAAMGLTALAMLYIIRSACKFAARRLPNKKKLFFFVNTLRTVFVILLYTMISWLVNRNFRSKPKFTILGNVPRGMFIAKVSPWVAFSLRC
jgi:sodium-independent sulfate anion transporter 11